ncbi:MAG: S9 family peptidase [Planctomycetes bacterium]|nr:S9 family peptidase [Planctomycetota bacterium]
MRHSAVLVALLLPLPVAAQEKTRRPMRVDDLFRFQRVSDPRVRPVGSLVAYVVGTVDMDANKVTSSIWLLPTAGGEARQLTNSGKSDRHPRWSPDGRHILFESNRSGDSQLWLIGVDGGEARQLTKVSTSARNALWSRDGKRIAFVSAVWPEFSSKLFKESDALNKKRSDERAKSPIKARVFTKLFFRHWDEYVEDKRQHLFVLDLTEGLHAKGEPRDVTPGDRDADPTSSTFSMGDDFTFSPDGEYLLFTAPPEKNEAWSTNYDICRVPVKGGKIECLTKDNPAADGSPRFSPDGKQLAFRAQKRAGFEADRWQLYVIRVDPSGSFQDKPRSVTADLDSSVEDFVWTPSSDTLLFTAEAAGHLPIYQLSLNTGKVRKLIAAATNSSLSMGDEGPVLSFSQASFLSPPSVHSIDLDTGKLLGRSKQNAAVLAELDLPKVESVTVKGADDVPMQMWILKPPGFDPAKKWPLVYLVHGGPQGAWMDAWSYRWNPQLWAAQGYVVALPNPRGSTGFGQKYVDEISGDWGGKCYQDLMAGVAYLEKQPYVDAQRMAAAGASFGGYMMNWFAVNTGKFKTLITHCGVWNFDSMYATTEELWFDEWDHGGVPWGKNRASYEKYSPHRFAKNLAKHRTPMLIIHNDLDFRVPISEGVQLFTTLQRMGIPSRMINFPDEGHWVLRPQNSRYWHREVFAWLKKYVAPGGR